MAITLSATQTNINVTGYSAGTPCTMADIYAADLAATNGRQLYTGTAGASPFSISLGTQVVGLVTTQPFCADSHGVKLNITCTARAGATCTLTGVKRDGDAVTEVIDVSSGTAQSVYKYFTLNTNGIVFTGLTAGDTITIKQDRWGVVSKIQQTYPGCYNTDKYWMCEGGIGIGSGATAGYFSSKNELIFFAGNHGFSSGSTGTYSGIYFGELLNSKPANGSTIVCDQGNANKTVMSIGYGGGGGSTGYIYDTTIRTLNRTLAYGASIGNSYWGSVLIKGIHTNLSVESEGPINLDDINVYNSPVNGILTGAGSTLSNLRVHNITAGYSFSGQGISDFVTGYTADGTHATEFMEFYAGYSPTTARLNDCIHSDTKIWTNGASNIYRTTYVNVTVENNAGVGIDTAYMTIKDMDGNIVSYNPAVLSNNISLFAATTDIVAGGSWLTGGFAVGDVIVQDAEFMLITAIGGTGNKTATVTRGYYSKYPAVYHYQKPLYKVGSVPSNSSGVFAQQIIPLKRYLRTAGSIGGASLTTTYSSHTIEITKAGYEKYKDVIAFTENRLTGQNLEVGLNRNNLSLTKTAKFG